MHVLRPTVLRAVAAAALVAASGVLAAPPASAHNVVVGTAPAAGATVTALPTEVVLDLEEPPLAGGTAIVVRDPAGALVTSGTAVIDGPRASVALQPLTVAGMYGVSYRSASDDGHTITGSFAFTVPASLVPDAAPSASPTASSATVAPTASSADAGSSAGALPWVLGGLAVVVVVGTALALVRRRSA